MNRTMANVCDAKDAGQRKDPFFFALFHYGSAIARLDRS
jgi:hypothetical protein